MDAQKSPSIEEKTSREKRPVTPIVVGVALPVVVILSVIILAVLVKYTALGKRIWKRLKFPRVGQSKEQQISKTQNVEDKSPTKTASPFLMKPCQNGTREHTTEPDETSVMLDTDEKSAEEKSESDSGYQVEGGLHRSRSTECVSPSKQNYRNSSGGRHCSVRGCSYNEKKLKEILNRPCFDHFPLLRKDCSCDAPFRLHSPKTEEQRREWLANLRLKAPPKYLFVCSFHFVEKKPTFENPSPQCMLGYKREVKVGRRILVRKNREQQPCDQKAGQKRKHSDHSDLLPIPEKQRRTSESEEDHEQEVLLLEENQPFWRLYFQTIRHSPE